MICGMLDLQYSYRNDLDTILGKFAALDQMKGSAKVEEKLTQTTNVAFDVDL